MSGALRVGVVGAGNMGANHARVVAASPRAQLAVVVDADPDRAAAVAAEHGAARAGQWLDDLGAVDAVILATPTESHVALARDLLSAGVPVLVEKPVATTVEDVEKLLDDSVASGVPVLGGFVERFNPAVATAVAMLDTSPIHLVAIRHSPAAPRIETSVVFDLLIHDLDLAVRLGGAGGSVTGVATPVGGSPTAELADCTVRFPGGLVATLSASRAGQRKVRQVTITTENAVYDIDLLRQDLSVYRHVRHEQVVAGARAYRAATTVDIPFVRHGGEPLALQLEHFCDLVEGLADAGAARAGILEPHVLACAVERFR